ncbi:MAG: hypothetical protein HYS25_13755 [Ignavibacteriales bacterium]|nr:hypothetical protein [Ignavibacteriales bacterium]
MTHVEKLLSQTERIIDRLKANHEKELIESYKRALADIKTKISVMYEKYGDQVQYSDMVRLKRLQSLEDQINVIVKNLNKETTTTITSAVKNVFQESYYHTGYSFEALVNRSLNFGRLTESVVNASLKNPLDKIGWGKRNKQNILEMTKAVRDEITQGLIQGKGYTVTARAINDRLNIGVNKSLKVVRTETHRVQNKALSDSFSTAKKSFEKIRIDLKKIWDATLDTRTRQRHRDMDGEIANEEGKFNFYGKMVDGPGMVGDPQEDIHCRCRIRFQFKGYSPKVRRDNVSGEIITYKTYNEWKQSLS